MQPTAVAPHLSYEHLTQANCRVYAACRRLLKEHEIVSTWTRYGTVHVKRTENSKAM